MKVNIRKLKEEDLIHHRELFNEVLTNDFPEYQTRVAKVYRAHIFNQKYFKKFIKKKINCILGAFDGKKLIGFLVMYGHNGGVMEFIWLAVNRNYRKNGIGSRLLIEGEKWSLKNKFHYVFFHTENIKQVEFYKRKGYEHLGLQRKMYFGIDEHLMQKVLKEAPFEEIFEKYFK